MEIKAERSCRKIAGYVSETDAYPAIFVWLLFSKLQLRLKEYTVQRIKY